MATTPKGSKPSGEITLRVVLESTDETPTYYVNFAEVSHSRNEFSLSVVRVPTKINQRTLASSQKSGEITLEPALTLILPPVMIPGLIKALQAQQAAYEENVGRIPEREER